jgi:hypothetical protein
LIKFADQLLWDGYFRCSSIVEVGLPCDFCSHTTYIDSEHHLIDEPAIARNEDNIGGPKKKQVPNPQGTKAVDLIAQHILPNSTLHVIGPSSI